MYKLLINMNCPYLRFEESGKRFAILKKYFLCDKKGNIFDSTFEGYTLVEWVEVPETSECKIVKIVAEKSHLQMVFNIANDLKLTFF